MNKIKSMKMYQAAVLIAMLTLSACGGGGGTSPPVTPVPSVPSVQVSVSDISPLVAYTDQQGTFTIKGVNLPLTAYASITNAGCADPTNRTATGFTVQCQFGAVVGAQTISVLTNAGGQVIDASRKVVVSTAPLPASVSAISPLVGYANQQVTFTIEGVSLPLTAQATIANATCTVPTNRTATGFTVQCQLGSVVGAQTISILTNAPSSGGQVIDASKQVTVSSAPVIASVSSISPLVGYANQQVTFTIQGMNLPLTAQATIANATCAVPTSRTVTGFVVQCQLGAALGAQTISILTNVGGQVIDASRKVTVSSAPVIASVSDISPLVGYANQQVTFTIQGVNLPLTAQATIANATCAVPTSRAATGFVVQCQLGAALGAQTISILTNVGGQIIDASKKVTVSTAPALPSVTNISPLVGNTNEQVTFTIKGTNLPLTASATIVDATCSTPTNQTATGFMVQCKLGAAVGTKAISIFTNALGNGGQVIDATRVVTVSTAPVPPSVSTISPLVGYTNEQVTFTIKGANLPLTALATILDATCATPTSRAITGFTVQCKLGTVVGAQTISILTNALSSGGQVIDASKKVTVSTAPVPASVSSISPLVGYANQQVTFTIQGVNLPLTAQATIANATCAVPTSRTVTGFVVQCQLGAALGAQTISILTNVGGQVIDASRKVTVSTAPVSTSKLADTGITPTQCYQAGSDVLVSCASAGALALNDKQDGMQGRDVSTPNASDGKLGFSYSLVPNASGGSYDKTECIKDNITGLTWEGKPTSGLRINTATYTNYGDGRAGDASAFVNAVNAQGLCGYKDWRLPKIEELKNLVDYSLLATSVVVDATWLPNTMNYVYWSSTPYAGDTNLGWALGFQSGDLNGFNAHNDINYVRLVR